MRLSEIPFPCEDWFEALKIRNAMEEAGFLIDTRGDTLAILNENSTWYVLVRTGNIRGMIKDLEDNGFLS